MQRRYNLAYFIIASIVGLGFMSLMISVDAQAQIAFASERDGNLDIYVMDIDGKNLRRLTKNLGNAWNPSWSPNGERIAFTSNGNGNNDIYVMNANGKIPQNLTGKFFEQDVTPAWFHPPLAIAPAGRTLTMWGWLKRIGQ